MSPEAEELFREIQGFLKKEKIRMIASARDVESPRCRYALPFTFRCPEAHNTCVSETRKAELPNASLKCGFIGHQSECPYYQPDPDHLIRLQFLQSFDQLKEEVRLLKIAYEKTGAGETLDRAIKIMSKLVKLVERGTSIRGLFAGVPHFALLAHKMELLALKEERKRHEKQMPWYRRFF